MIASLFNNKLESEATGYAKEIQSQKNTSDDISSGNGLEFQLKNFTSHFCYRLGRYQANI